MIIQSGWRKTENTLNSSDKEQDSPHIHHCYPRPPPSSISNSKFSLAILRATHALCSQKDHLRVACTQTSGQFSHWAPEPRQNSTRGFSVQDHCANSGKGHVKIILRRQDHADCALMTGSKSNSEVILHKAPSPKMGEVSAKRGGKRKHTLCDTRWGAVQWMASWTLCLHSYRSTQAREHKSWEIKGKRVWLLAWGTGQDEVNDQTGDGGM